jgi:hypothetical protein
MGTVFCKDAVACQVIHGVLQKHIGKPFKQIGDLEIPSLY